MRRLTLTAAIAGSCLAVWAVVPILGGAAPTASELNKRIEQTQGKIEFRRGKERVLTTDINKYSERIGALEGRLRGLRSREGALNADLREKRAILSRTQTQLREERTRLVRLQRRYREVRLTLETRIVQLYKEGRPDLATVIVEADGFTQLIDRGEYVTRLAERDRQIIGIVGSARTDAKTTERRLAKLETRQQRVTAAVQARRDEAARVRSRVSSTQNDLRAARNDRRGLLQSVKGDRKALEQDLAKMQEQQARISGILTGASGEAPKRGSGRFVWPVNGPITSPWCERRSWESCHPGIDIGVPTGTPVRAADNGRVAISGWVGGYGNFICIQHTAALSTCYGHNSRLLVRVGQSVTQGQVIAAAGSTGHSTGPHVHFEVRINGRVTNPMNYL